MTNGKTSTFLKKTNMWTVILHFGRGHAEIHSGLTMEHAKNIMRIAVFGNRDCVNAHVFLQNQDDPRDQPDYPTE
jgi:hypothetical protein